MCEAYEIGWDFVIAQEQQQQWQQPHKNLAASHTGEGPSCIYLSHQAEESINHHYDVQFIIHM